MADLFDFFDFFFLFCFFFFSRRRRLLYRLSLKKPNETERTTESRGGGRGEEKQLTDLASSWRYFQLLCWYRWRCWRTSPSFPVGFTISHHSRTAPCAIFIFIFFFPFRHFGFSNRKHMVCSNRKARPRDGSRFSHTKQNFPSDDSTDGRVKERMTTTTTTTWLFGRFKWTDTRRLNINSLGGEYDQRLADWKCFCR